MAKKVSFAKKVTPKKAKTKAKAPDFPFGANAKVRTRKGGFGGGST